MDIVTQDVTVVEYNRSARQWEARNGRTWAWPAGPEGKRQAELCALGHDVPDVAEQVKTLIADAQRRRLEMFDDEAITQRAIKAGFIIRDGQLLPPVSFDQYGGCINEIARCQGNQPEPYIISYVDDQVICDCHDFMLGNAPFLPSGQSACKHILATLIIETIESQYEPEPPQPRRPKTERDALRRYAIETELT